MQESVSVIINSCYISVVLFSFFYIKYELLANLLTFSLDI